MLIQVHQLGWGIGKTDGFVHYCDCGEYLFTSKERHECEAYCKRCTFERLVPSMSVHGFSVKLIPGIIEATAAGNPRALSEISKTVNKLVAALKHPQKRTGTNG